ncbi:hypothetical protein NADFUDRAFT_49290 [Nadsonia fulvescens var. elongata DSM 6958]|uniref:CCA tRNA nucleotidyltransferase, mitochondrial n=1 Tax=Nadsonia fulvescens var. elongata DSM 6958 TaxID=857566 RepID=A0A1E3PTJ2_9ASCO|nr:hypothetical protein NADFUDRAFT_49290 [Nadsonia fulvescens var. elongata DSM 6958]
MSPLSSLSSLQLDGDKAQLSEIKLTATERRIRELLVEFSAVMDQVNPADPKLVLRFTGGWVRDKLLGLESNDIDVAINHMTGAEFADALNVYIIENSQRLGIKAHHIHKIEKNPEKSKHLETATTKIFDQDVDFVNLRSEEYTEDSRIPVTQFGTPEQDAFRRDATLNSLFYNLQSQQVEDLTHAGIQDLKNKILRTPLPALRTFQDDPLRVLRLIRFSSRFNFDIAPDAQTAMADSSICEALATKISRERVGIEIEKTFRGPNPELALQWIGKFNLEGAIFHLPARFYPEGLQTPSSNLVRSTKVWKETLEQPEIKHDLFNDVLADTYSWRNLWFLCVLNRWGGVMALTEKKKPYSAVSQIIKEGLKLPGNEGDSIAKITQVEQLVAETVKRNSQQPLSRKDIGLILRVCGQNWKLAILFSLLKEICNNDINSVLPRYREFLKAITDMNLCDIWSIRPLVAGNVFAKEFNLRPGPWLAPLLEKIVEWQLNNPGCTTQECITYVRENKDKLISVQR